MRLTTVILLASFLQVSAAGFAQKITLSEKNVPLVALFKKIRLQSGYDFIFTSKVLKEASKVTIEVKDTELKEVLNQIFKNQPLEYVFDAKTVVVSRKASFKSNLGNTLVDILELSGRIVDSKGNPLPGVSIKLKGTSVGAITNSDGYYSIKIPNSNGILIFSYVGFAAVEIPVNGKTLINVILQEESSKLNDVVVVGYGTQKKESITGGIASVKGEELAVAPLASTANTLAGRLPGLISLQSSGQPGADAAALSIRGFGSALVIVDGVEASFNSIDPNAIESISILKDGAASIYGARAGNGVILVTTKRGRNEKPLVTLNSNYTLQGITIMPKPVSSGQYAEMVAEEWLQSGKPASTVPYTPEQIQKFYNGTDPLYPNTNWYDMLIRDWAPQQQHNLSVRGGSERIKYYGFIGFLNQGSVWKNNGGDYSRYNLQSNIDAKITDDLSLQLDVASTFEIRKSTWRPQVAGGNSVWQDFWHTLPIYPATLPDPEKVSFANGGGTGGAHVVTNRDIAGYNDYDNQNIRATLSLNYNVSAIKGLSARGFVNVIQDYGTNKNFSRPVNFYTYDPASNMYTLAGALGTKASIFLNKNQERRISGQFSMKYDRIFNEDHHFTGLGLYEVIDYYSDYLTASRVNFLTPAIDQIFAGSTNGMANNGAASEMGRKSFVGRLNYSFKNRYLIETSLRADASAKFPSNKRWGYFPGISAGWKLNEEAFMKQFTHLDNLKIRASYGESGNDEVGNFQYLSGYQYGNTYVFDGTALQGLRTTGLANPELTWEKIKIYNIGADFSFWNKKLYGELDAFYRTRKGIPATRLTTLPSTFGAPLPPENINSLNDRGFELRLGTAGNVSDFSWDVSGNISWSRAKWDHYEEPVYADQTQARIAQLSGRWTDQAFGYLSDGLFTTQEQINNLPFNQDGQNNISLKPGDIKYKDINGDGVLDWKDQDKIGKGTIPHWMIGFNTNLKYRNFDLSALFQGALGYYKYIKLQQGPLPPEEMYNERWTEVNNNPNALAPRLGGALTNALYSDYYYKKAGYLRLKVLNIGYSLSKKLLDRTGFNQLRIYMAGTNLLTWDKLKKYGTDPEAPNGNTGFYYPQQKTVTIGVNVSL